MKIIQKVLAGLFFLSIGIAAQAQEVSHSIGVRGGLHLADVTVPTIQDNLNINPKGISSFEAALIYELHLGENFSFRPEIGYAKKGFVLDEGIDFEIANFPLGLGAEALTEVHYIQIPLLGKYSFGEGVARPYIMAGPSFGYAAKATLQTKINSIIDFNVGKTDIDLTNNNYERIEWAGVLGAGVEMEAGPGSLFAEARYIHSFTDMLNDTRVDFRLRSKGIGLSAGYKVNF